MANTNVLDVLGLQLYVRPFDTDGGCTCIDGSRAVPICVADMLAKSCRRPYGGETYPRQVLISHKRAPWLGKPYFLEYARSEELCKSNHSGGETPLRPWWLWLQMLFTSARPRDFCTPGSPVGVVNAEPGHS